MPPESNWCLVPFRDVFREIIPPPVSRHWGKSGIVSWTNIYSRSSVFKENEIKIRKLNVAPGMRSFEGNFDASTPSIPVFLLFLSLFILSLYFSFVLRSHAAFYPARKVHFLHIRGILIFGISLVLPRYSTCERTHTNRTLVSKSLVTSGVRRTLTWMRKEKNTDERSRDDGLKKQSTT